ncbi:winged helix DNA-binding domain-containing protein [Nocardioides speluncae]|uniref:winged helix DNA-binding domain-containing protein n=1 Tax=Nocardioides speluncae TaxID=2670337 RepID=UPI000D68836A|nr:winged helix DNA-binding domain-containing protein [Nocardioides speluncae]
MQLSPRDLNRTFLHRQHLLERTTRPIPHVVEHLIGLQAQENLPPYLSLAARLAEFDPYAVSAALEDKSLVRLLCMRGTIHLLVPGDALTLRQWTQPCQDRERKHSQNVIEALHLDTAEVNAAISEALLDGPLAMKTLGEALEERFPGVPGNALAHLARINQPLAQLPPRGQWKKPGGVIYQYVDRWLGEPLREPDVAEIVRRYLRAYGPATAADVTAWSGVTRLVPVLKGMDDLVQHAGENGKTLYDVPEGEIVTGETPAPVRLLGVYDNVWLSHAGRDRVTDPVKRKNWMGVNGGIGNTIFVDGMLEGMWRVEDGTITVTTYRDLTKPEQSDLDEELDRAKVLLAR